MIKAIFLDFDGVMVDTEFLHYKGFDFVLKDNGTTHLTWKDYQKRYLGYGDRECFQAVLRDKGYSYSQALIARLISKKTRLMKDYFRKHPVLLKGVKNWVQKFSKKYPLFIVSGSSKAEIRIILRREKLLRYFQGIIAAEDVKKGKPHPQGYKKALILLNRGFQKKIRPLECLVVEDSHWGIEAAHRAGMSCVALTTSYSRSQLKEADDIFSSLSDLQLDTFWES